jgi:outer membrane protein W
VWIGNLGASYKLIQDLKLSADLWYAIRAEDVKIATAPGASQAHSASLGTELDLVATYTIVDNLKLDLIGAYLWAGDAITKSVDPYGSTNPIELAAQLSLAF